MIARRPTLSRRQRREIQARAPYSINVHPLSDGEWRAIVVEDCDGPNKEPYRSGPMSSPEEALALAVYELDGIVERIVDEMEAQDEREGL